MELGAETHSIRLVVRGDSCPSIDDCLHLNRRNTKWMGLQITLVLEILVKMATLKVFSFFEECRE